MADIIVNKASAIIRKTLQRSTELALSRYWLSCRMMAALSSPLNLLTARHRDALELLMSKPTVRICWAWPVRRRWPVNSSRPILRRRKIGFFAARL